MERFLIIDDHYAIALGVESMLLEVYHKCLCKLVTDNVNIIKEIDLFEPTLIILDLHLPGVDTYNIIDYTIKKGIKLLIYTSSNLQIIGLHLLHLGVNGILGKNTNEASFRNAVADVLSGKRYMDKDLKLQFLNKDSKKLSNDNPFHVLSAREHEVMLHLAKGFGLAEISCNLNLSVSTIGTQKARIFSKLNIKSNFELIEMAKFYKFV